MAVGWLSHVHTHQIRAATVSLLLIKVFGKSPASARSLNGLPSVHSLQPQQFNYTWVRLIKHGQRCLAPGTEKGPLRLQPCDNRNTSLKWLHKSALAFHPELVSKRSVPSLHHTVNFSGRGHKAPIISPISQKS